MIFKKQVNEIVEVWHDQFTLIGRLGIVDKEYRFFAIKGWPFTASELKEISEYMICIPKQ